MTIAPSHTKKAIFSFACTFQNKQLFSCDSAQYIKVAYTRTKRKSVKIALHRYTSIFFQENVATDTDSNILFMEPLLHKTIICTNLAQGGLKRFI